jgi:two-component system, NtrC family, nitrogen regulation sensor histidine kinase NtrY
VRSLDLRTALLSLAVLVAAGLAAFALLQEPLAAAWPMRAVPAETLPLLAASMDDQKRLAELDPAAAGEHRRRFEELRTLSGRLRILAHNRERMAARYRVLLLALVGGALVVAGAGLSWRRGRDERRVERLRRAVETLAAGEGEVRLGDRRRDTLGRLGRIVEAASRAVGRDRRRLASLANLAAWQEASRRHAHELRTPLTAARLELDRLRARAVGGAPAAEVEAAADALSAELDRLARFAHRFVSFARLPAPRPRRDDLAAFAAETVEAFRASWPAAEVRVARPAGEVAADFDRELLRQVLVNLLDNAAQALGEGGGRVTVTVAPTADGRPALEVADDGPGVPETLRERLFEPYVTGRPGAGGSGLGLAIARKIALDHGGDLELAPGAPPGARFRLTLPAAGASP